MTNRIRLQGLGRVAAALSLSLALAGCFGDEPQTPASSAPVGDVTNAPVGAGINIPPGSNEDFIVNVGRRVYFNEGSADLSEASKDTLDKQAEWLVRYGRYRVKVQGFADDPGGKEANEALGMRRAKAVHDYLVAKGVPAGRMKMKTYGNIKERLVNNCPEIACKAQNRRVVTNLQNDFDS